MDQRQIEDAIWRVTMRILGYGDNEQGKVRISWPLDEMGSPNWSRTETTVFIRVSQLLDNYSELWDITYNGGSGFSEDVSNHQAYEVNWIVYGSDALEAAQKLRYGLLRESIRQELKAAGMAFKTEIRMPVHMPEQDRSGDWWNRYDLSAQLYSKQVRSFGMDYIGEAPSISVSYVEYPDFVLDLSVLDVDRLGNVVTQTTIKAEV